MTARAKLKLRVQISRSIIYSNYGSKVLDCGDELVHIFYAKSQVFEPF